MEFGGFLLAIFICIAVASTIVFLIRKAAPAPTSLPVTAGWIEELSLDRYRPMLRILATDDLLLLRSQPGCTRSMIAKLRSQRCRIFREYLRALREDFGRVCLALKLLMVQAGNDRPDLAAVLVQKQAQFALGLALVHLRLTLYSAGFGTVEVGGLLAIFDGLRLELRTLVPVSAESAG
jgi:hypothetical protein